MTDETPTAPDSDGAPEGDDAPAAGAVVAPAPTAAVEPPAEPVPFWRSPNFERYFAPLLIPIIAVLGIVIMVLNISRIFLSAHGHIPVVVGSIITGAILFGASIISNSSRLRSSSQSLLTIGFVLLLISGGWLVLGHSQVKGGTLVSLPATGPCSGSLSVTALPALKFTPASLSVKTGVYCITLNDGAAATHTLDFDNPDTLFPGVVVNTQGEKVSGRIFFGTATDYTYFCAVPGHRAAGMVGVVHVTGPTMTVDQAEAAAGGSSGASGASGAGGASGASGAGGASGSTG
jgi:plastocyanin